VSTSPAGRVIPAPANLPRLQLADGTVEALKWLAFVLMVIDHINKYVLHDRYPVMFALGRSALPLFAFVLGYNLARPGALTSGRYARTLARLAIAGAAASVPFMELGGLLWRWWPLNVMAMLAVATGIIWLLDRNGWSGKVGAAALFVVGGSSVEFWWPGIAVCVAAWIYCRRPRCLALACWIAAVALLSVINGNHWAFAALPIIFISPSLRLPILRLRHAFYVLYPTHLVCIWVLVRHAG
jgi:hypothetical protein